MLIIDQLKQENHFTKTEKPIVQYIMENPKKVTTMSIHELAEATYSSNATIIRICKKLNLSGFPELKIQISSELNTFLIKNERIDQNVPIRNSIDKKEIANEMLMLHYQSLTDTYNSLDQQSIYKAAQMIDRSDIVFLFGRNESLLALKSFQSDLARIKKRTLIEMTVGFDHVDYIDKKEKSCAVILTQYFNNTKLITIFDILLENSIPVILIHGNTNNLLAKKATISIEFPNSEQYLKTGAFASRVTKQYILDVLFSNVFAIHYDQNMEYIKEYELLLKNRKSKIEKTEL